VFLPDLIASEASRANGGIQIASKALPFSMTFAITREDSKPLTFASGGGRL